MTQEEKLLLNALSAMLPYSVVLHFDNKVEQDDEVLFSIRENSNRYLINDAYYLGEVKPYLRPLSSMTEDETNQYHSFFTTFQRGLITPDNAVKLFDWLNAHHFDYRGLIEKGLAIKVNKNNNPYI